MKSLKDGGCVFLLANKCHKTCGTVLNSLKRAYSITQDAKRFQTRGDMGLIDTVALGLYIRNPRTAMNGGKKKTKPTESSNDEDYHCLFALSHIPTEGPEKLGLNELSVVDGCMDAFRSSIEALCEIQTNTFIIHSSIRQMTPITCLIIV
ncbi:hypothetical protein GQR58_026819 [Nymphon striatum]|nr:hypothetical protein GQR58_026819 [Nymphon striatum]